MIASKAASMIAQLEARAQSAETRARAAEAEVKRVQKTADALRAERDELKRALKELRHENRQIHSDLAAESARLASAVSLRRVLSERGLLDQTEMDVALRGVIEQRPGDFIDAVELCDGKPLADLLAHRLLLVHGDSGEDLHADCVRLPVTRERCELTGGSDIRAAYRAFFDICQQAGIRAVTIVGGSPAYREQLRRLSEPHRRQLRLNLVSGTLRRTRRRAEADLRNSDAVVIWGGTELDHSVSSVYGGDSGRLLRISHRGISRMLNELGRMLAKK